MKKKEYRAIICNQTEQIKRLREQNEALKKSYKRAKLGTVARLVDLSVKIGNECMIPESKVVDMCIEEVKKAYV